MQIIRDVSALRTARAGLARRVALVPTMGALHAGHMALVAEAARVADHVVASIFVNPLQFGPTEDLDAYPRAEAADVGMLEVAGAAILWVPTVAAMYPDGFATTVSVAGVSEGLCAGTRPGHFDGVATVVAKLLGQVRPDLAVFGEKDWQQLAVVRRMAADLDLGVEIVGVPVQRDADGLALSSRNAYLSAEDRGRAGALPCALMGAAKAIGRGGDAASAINGAVKKLEQAGFGVEYLELRDADSLSLPIVGRARRLLAAARIGSTRLIDNVAVKG